ncbi:hypothetical protein BX600DRAFT_467469 [Xylariales sp. PMI_506]|nr:hypothetical protein BX600DRAFT_467469 [Xylariales sp. PMI_506]
MTASIPTNKTTSVVTNNTVPPSDGLAMTEPINPDVNKPSCSETEPTLTALRGVLAWTTETPEDDEHFRSIPWTNKLLSTPGVRVFRPDFPGRPARGPDPMIHGILCREGGISHYACLIAEPGVLPPLQTRSSADIAVPVATRIQQSDNSSAKSMATVPPGQPTLSTAVPMHLDLYTVGSALYGVPNTIHGGLAAVLCDMAFVKVVWVESKPGSNYYSKHTNVEFVRPMVTDADGSLTLIVKAQLNPLLSTEKKLVIIGSVEGVDGMVYVRAQGMVVNSSWKSRL